MAKHGKAITAKLIRHDQQDVRLLCPNCIGKTSGSYKNAKEPCNVSCEPFDHWLNGMLEGEGEGGKLPNAMVWSQQ